MQIKLLHKVMILVAIPLCFEVTIFSVLMNLQTQVENEAAIMDRNKKINDAVNGIIHNLFSLAATGRRKSLTALSPSYLAAMLNQINGRLTLLKTLTQGDPQLSRAVLVCEAGILKAQHDVVEVRSAMSKASSADEAVEIFKTYRRRIDDDLQQSVQAGLADLADKTVAGTGDERSRALRERIRLLLKAALVASFLFAILAAYLYGQNFSGRLAKLRENSLRLAKSEELLPQVEGTDEIAELDKVMHYAGVLVTDTIKMKDEVTSMITHDLKSPLQSIGMFFQMLDHGAFGAINEEGRELLKMTDQESQRMLQLIDSILELEKLRSGAAVLKNDLINISAVLDNAINALELIARQKNVEIHRRYESISLRGDAFWLEQVFVNILSNAIKYSPTNAVVTVETATSADKLLVSITDRGQGISKEEQQRIFQKFNRLASTSHLASGTGLGLTIAKELMEIQKGNIEVESQLGEGSKFTVCLPIAGAGKN